MDRQTRPSAAVPLVGVTIAQRPGARLPDDATDLERSIFGLADVPRAPIALCSVLPVPSVVAVSTLRRLVDAGYLRVLSARSNPNVPFRRGCRLPSEAHDNGPTSRAPTLRPGELHAILDEPR